MEQSCCISNETENNLSRTQRDKILQSTHPELMSQYQFPVAAH